MTYFCFRLFMWGFLGDGNEEVLFGSLRVTFEKNSIEIFRAGFYKIGIFSFGFMAANRPILSYRKPYIQTYIHI